MASLLEQTSCSLESVGGLQLQQHQEGQRVMTHTHKDIFTYTLTERTNKLLIYKIMASKTHLTQGGHS
jgi:hypothetical protein